MKEDLLKSLSVVLSLLMVLSMIPLGVFTLTASAETEYTDGYYTYLVTDGKAVVTDVDSNVGGSVVIPNKLGEYPVVGIGDSVFNACYDITSVILPDSITSIGYGAFSLCTKLERIVIPDSVTSIGVHAFTDTAFERNDDNWKNNVLYIGNHLIKANTDISGDYTIKDGTVTIADGAFSNCKKLVSLTLPSSVTSIGNSAFYDCYGLTNLYITDLAAWCTIDFEYSNYSNPLYYADNFYLNGEKISGEIVLPEGVKNIPDYTFSGSEVASIVIPDSVINIGKYAFYGCFSITEINVGANNSFYSSKDGVLFNKEATVLILYPYGKSDSTYVIPDGTTSIESNAFPGCYNITSITFPDSVTTIGWDAFGSGIDSVYITDLAAWCNIDFGDEESNPLHSDFFWSGRKMYLNDELITELAIPEGVTSVNDYAFINCADFTSVSIPDSVTKIGASAFDGCRNLESIMLSNSITKIGAFAFYNCENLTHVLYTGDKKERESIEINSYNEELEQATWHYNVCGINGHKYDSDCDNECNNCSWKRTVNSDHTFNDDNLCALCGYNRITDYITYWISDNTVSISNCSANISGGCIIPSTIEGYPVTSIDGWAFDNCSKLTIITIPDTVTNIGIMAFWGCSSLTSVTIPDSVTSIGDIAFSNCDSLTSVTIPDSVTSIGSYAFGGCDNLKTVTIGKGAISIAENAFNDDYAMEKYVVDAKNTAYSSDENGVLFNKKKTRIIAYPSANTAKEYSLPESVTDIVYFAFGNCDNLTKVDMPESVKSIDVDAFRDCDNLSDIVVPKTVKSVEENAFFGCDRLDDIWYLGSEQNKSGISIKDGNESLEAADWHYNTCKPGEHKFTDDNDKTCENCDWSLAEPGDTNDDGNINNKDLGLLMQHLNGWKVEINADAADVNGDGKINNKDYGLLMQYCNGWDVKLQ